MQNVRQKNTSSNPSVEGSATRAADANALRALIDARCQRRTRHVIWVRAFERFSQISWQGLGLLLCVYLAVRYFAIPEMPVFIALLVWLLGVAIFVAAKQPDRPPRWQATAWLDKHSGAHGALMAGSDAGRAGIPDQATSIAFPKIYSHRVSVGWLLLVAAWLAAGLVTPAARGSVDATQLLPEQLTVTEERIEQLARLKPENPLLDNAKKMLDELAAKQSLTRDDLDALRRLDEAARDALQGIDQNPGQGQQNGENADQASQQNDLDALQQALDQLSNTPGEDQSSLEKQLQAMMQAAQAGQNGQPGDNGSEQGLAKAIENAQQAMANGSFSQAQIEQLKQQLQRHREQQSNAGGQGATAVDGEGLSGAEGEAGVKRGPGTADHSGGTTFERDGARFDAEGFGLNPDTETVLIGTSLMREGEAAVLDPGANAVGGDQAGFSEQWHKRSLPRHRNAIQNYFQPQRPNSE